MRSFALPRTRQGSTENSPVLDMVKVLGTHGGQYLLPPQQTATSSVA